MKFEDISPGWLKEAIIVNNYLTTIDIKKAMLKLSAFKDKIHSDYVEFDIREEDEDEMIAHKKVEAVFIDGSFYIPTVNYIRC